MLPCGRTSARGSGDRQWRLPAVVGRGAGGRRGWGGEKSEMAREGRPGRALFRGKRSSRAAPSDRRRLGTAPPPDMADDMPAAQPPPIRRTVPSARHAEEATAIPAAHCASWLILGAKQDSIWVGGCRGSECALRRCARARRRAAFAQIECARAAARRRAGAGPAGTRTGSRSPRWPARPGPAARPKSPAPTRTAAAAAPPPAPPGRSRRGASG